MAFETLGVRSLVTVIFGPFILFCAWQGGYVFLTLISSIVIFGINEFYELCAKKGTAPQRSLGIVSGLALCFVMFKNQLNHVWMIFAGAVFVILVIELFRNEDSPVLNVAATVLGFCYAGFLIAFLLLIRELPLQSNVPSGLGGRLVILIFLCVWLCDTAAYLLGSRIGKTKLFERVSPNKTVEGTAAGFVFALVTAAICQVTFLNTISLPHVLVIGGICGSVGQVSDLLESLFKRDAGVKDSSNLIPGHGGILDRFDSEILTAPVVYFYLVYVVY